MLRAATLVSGRGLRKVAFEGSGLLVFLSAYLAFTIAPASLLFQVLAWLRTAHWPHWTARTLLEHFGGHPPHVTWAGVQKIFDWFFAIPLWLSSLLAGVALLVLALGLTGLATETAEHTHAGEGQ